jgi:hypothetical protein
MLFGVVHIRLQRQALLVRFDGAAGVALGFASATHPKTSWCIRSDVGSSDKIRLRRGEIVQPKLRHPAR